MKRTALALTFMFTLLISALAGMPAASSSQNGTNNQSNTAPTVSIVYPTNETVFNVSIGGVYFNVQYQTNDKLSWVGFSINGGGNVTCTGNTTDSNAFINDGYQFIGPRQTLTLYANDTDGNWATPQTVTYLVNFYADTFPSPPPTPSPVPTPTPTPSPTSSLTSSPTSSSPTTTPTTSASPTTSPTPTIPEFPTWIILPLFALAVLLSTVFIRKRMPKK